MKREDVVIVQAVRTAIGRAGGSLKGVNSGHLASAVIESAIMKSGIESHNVDEVIMGEVRPMTESSNVARVAALRAGVPEEATAFTVNRLCASGMQAIGSAVQQIAFGQAEVIIAGGTENLSQAPIYLRNSRYGEGNPHLVDSNLEAGQQPQEMYGKDLGMGMTAENVAKQYKVSREDQDVFALESQRRAKDAIESGRFKDEIIPIEVKERKRSFTFNVDEHPRETTLEKLASLRPAFKKDGSVTAGNACGRNDGAAAVMLMTRGKAEALGLKPLATVVDWATAGVSPNVMGIGPVPAVQKLLARTKLQKEDIGVWELNEAFASQALAVIRELGIREEDVNRNGGGIALGHPLGATGARITISLLHEMIRSDEAYGVSTLCVGGGQGMAMLLKKEVN
ncbi:thiolase family protein [Geomicrobium sp. JCM 19038]|uniref:thiolase family protein n=1 Tax=Geomicrobium sp. JCM 19038 TaxID=1460635 RepID=UPI00045F37A0|nr:thiolase family protein [Geomicrobium sp. JCM 19038]GAK08716.1 3-ketoacyl-CoA thiolase [Geomicrobium sp. JCM 19038]